MSTSTALTLETAAEAVRALGTWISLHTADPGTTGASEASGGSPAYARKQTTWTDGADDGVINGSEVTFDAPAGTYTHYGVRSASTAGTFIGGGALQSGGVDTPVVLGAQGSIKVTPTVTVANG